MTREVWKDRFDARYGAGEFTWLHARLQDPRYTFSSIAARYGVTRERVRQWHRLLMPDAPAGRARRRLHRRREDWRDLLHDPLFSAFRRHVRQHVRGARIRPVRTTHGYSRTRVLLNRHEVALRQITPRVRASRASRVLRVTRPAAPAPLVYVLLPDRTFFVLLEDLLPARGGAFDDAAPEYQPFRNTFKALLCADARASNTGDAAPTHAI